PAPRRRAPPWSGSAGRAWSWPRLRPRRSGRRPPPARPPARRDRRRSAALAPARRRPAAPAGRGLSPGAYRSPRAVESCSRGRYRLVRSLPPVGRALEPPEAAREYAPSRRATYRPGAKQYWSGPTFAGGVEHELVSARQRSGMGGVVSQERIARTG